MGVGDPGNDEQRPPERPGETRLPRPDMRAEIRKNRTAGEKVVMAILIIVVGIPVGLLVFGALLFGACLLGR